MKSIVYAVFTILFLVACQKDIEKKDAIIIQEANNVTIRRSNGFFAVVMGMNNTKNSKDESLMEIIIHLNETGSAQNIDSAKVVFSQGDAKDSIFLQLLGQEGLTRFMQGEIALNSNFNEKELIDFTIDYYKDGTYVASQNISKTYGLSMLSKDGKVLSNKLAPGIYPICYMFDSTQVDKRYAYNFTFVGMIVDPDSSINLDMAREKSKDKKLLLEWDRRFKIPSQYLKGDGYYPDLNIVFMRIDDLGKGFSDAMASNEEITFGLENNNYYWNTEAELTQETISAKKIKAGGGKQEKSLKAKLTARKRLR